MRFINVSNILFLCLLWSGVCIAGEGDVKAGEDRVVADLVRQLGADDFKARERAEASLAAMGDKAITELKKNESSKDPEIKLRVVRLLSKMNIGVLKDLFSRKGKLKGFGDDPGRSVWPCIMEVKEFNDKTGEFKGQIEWTNLSALNELEGKISEDKLEFKETKHIRRGNSVVGCVYTFDFKDEMNRKGRKIVGKWADPSNGRGGNVELEWE